jgi:hypothetical protein
MLWHIFYLPEIFMKNVTEVAEVLVELYGEIFGGKSMGRYRISRQGIRELAGRKRLEETILEQIIEEAYNLGYTVNYLDGDEFSVIKTAVMESYRKVPERLIAKYSDNE